MREKRSFKIHRTFDKELVHELHRRIFPEDHFPEEDTLDWIIYSEHGQPVGFCMAHPFDDEPDTMFFARAGVMRHVQGYGLHMRMIRVRERETRKLGFEKIATYTKMDNIQSSANLQKAGFRLYVPEDQYAEPDCLYWLKLLKTKKK